MNTKKPQFNVLASAITLPTVLMLLASSIEPVRAVPNDKALTINSTPAQEISLFDPPVDRGAPVTEGGASRGGELCNKVTALQPQDPNIKENSPFFGVTVAQQPTFFWYFKTPDKYAGKALKFTLMEYDAQSDKTQEIYQAESFYPETSGVMAVQIPIELEVGKNYQWYLEMECHPGTSNAETQSIEGWVERIETPSELSSQLSGAKTAIELTQVYANAGVWFDALNTLAQERMTADNPELQAMWQQLLQDIQKTSVGDAVFIDHQE